MTLCSGLFNDPDLFLRSPAPRLDTGEKLTIIETPYPPGMNVLFVAAARRQRQLAFTRRRLMSQSALTAAAAGEEVVSASEYPALEAK
jgi:transposase